MLIMQQLQMYYIINISIIRCNRNVLSSTTGVFRGAQRVLKFWFHAALQSSPVYRISFSLIIAIKNQHNIQPASKNAS